MLMESPFYFDLRPRSGFCWWANTNFDFPEKSGQAIRTHAPCGPGPEAGRDAGYVTTLFKIDFSGFSVSLKTIKKNENPA